MRYINLYLDNKNVLIKCQLFIQLISLLLLFPEQSTQLKLLKEIKMEELKK